MQHAKAGSVTIHNVCHSLRWRAKVACNQRERLNLVSYFRPASYGLKVPIVTNVRTSVKAHNSTLDGAEAARRLLSCSSLCQPARI